VVEKGIINDADEIELEKLRVFLCIGQKHTRETKKEICGRMFSQTVQFVLGIGLNTTELKDIQNVKKRKSELRLDDIMAQEILDVEARKVLMQFVSTSRAKSNPLDAAKVIKKMILF
jgi:hypothetical protein